MRRRRQPEIIAGAVGSDGSLAGATDPGFACSRTAVGNYDLTFPASFRVLSVTVTPVTGSVLIPVITAAGVPTYHVVILTTAGAATDTGFRFTAVGVQQ